MPLNSVTYLESHGWEGKGVPLDGKQGRGLKKPLALPMKRNLKGLGKDRDRAVEWWDCLFEASAKKIDIQVGSAKESVKEVALLECKKSSRRDDNAILKTGTKLSLESRAKRELARKMLMSGFVRGREVRKSVAEEELESKVLDQERDKQVSITAEEIFHLSSKDENIERIGSEKEERAKRKLEKSKRREQKEAKKMKREEKRIKFLKEAETNDSDTSKEVKRKQQKDEKIGERKRESKKTKKRKRH